MAPGSSRRECGVAAGGCRVRGGARAGRFQLAKGSRATGSSLRLVPYPCFLVRADNVLRSVSRWLGLARGAPAPRMSRSRPRGSPGISWAFMLAARRAAFRLLTLAMIGAARLVANLRFQPASGSDAPAFSYGLVRCLVFLPQACNAPGSRSRRAAREGQAPPPVSPPANWLPRACRG